MNLQTQNKIIKLAITKGNKYSLTIEQGDKFFYVVGYTHNYSESNELCFSLEEARESFNKKIALYKDIDGINLIVKE